MAVQPTDTVAVSPRVHVVVTTSSRGQEVRIDGRIDVRCAADLRLALHAALATGSGDLYVHLGDVEIGDSTGLGVLVEAHRRARREGRRLVLASITPRTARLLRVSRLDRVLHLASGTAASRRGVAALTA